MKVYFNDVDEFLTEIRQDTTLMQRSILRLTLRRRYRSPFVQVSLVSTAQVGKTVVMLEHRLGETFTGDIETGTELSKRAEALMEKINTAARELGLEVRPGVFEPTG